MEDQKNRLNFSLNKTASILIGSFLFIGTFLINSIIEGVEFYSNDTTIIFSLKTKFYIAVTTFLIFLFLILSIIFIEKIKAKKLDYTFWNSLTKDTFTNYSITLFSLFVILIFLLNQNYINLLAPFFLASYALILFLFKHKKDKNLLVISSICILLSIICFLIPSYWDSSIYILGIAHITNGIISST